MTAKQKKLLLALAEYMREIISDRDGDNFPSTKTFGAMVEDVRNES